MRRGKRNLALNPGDTAIIVPWFQPVGFHRPLSNILVMIHKLKALRLPFYIAELVVDGDQPEFTGRNVFHFASNVANFWHKEALIVAAAKRLPQKYTKVVWLDKDCSFSDDTWLMQLSAALEANHVVQPFEKVCRRPPHFRDCLRESLGRMAQMAQGCDSNRLKCGTSGFAMGVRRVILEKLGLLDRCVLGGGDEYFASAVYNEDAPRISGDVRKVMKRLEIPYDAYRDELQSLFGEPIRADYLTNVTIYHSYHGAASDPHYRDRYDILLKSSLSYRDLYKNSDGMWMAKNVDDWEFTFSPFFESRSEDEINPDDLI